VDTDGLNEGGIESRRRSDDRTNINISVHFLFYLFLSLLLLSKIISHYSTTLFHLRIFLN
ncbi:unnamed protein product, partial [Musa textilis]